MVFIFRGGGDEDLAGVGDIVSHARRVLAQGTQVGPAVACRAANGADPAQFSKTDEVNDDAKSLIPPSRDDLS